MQRLELVIFSSRQLIPIAEAIRENLRHHFIMTPWTEGFFRSNELSLNTFLKKLLCFDGAVVVLGADDLRSSQPEQAKTVWVPRDNVVFELGACMSRFGTQKTFIVCPEQPEVILPGYFKGIYPLKYEARADENLTAAVGSACVAIRQQLEQLDQMAYYSDLPAVGLSHGYFYNFVNPSYQRLKSSGRPLTFHGSWQHEHGFSLSVVIPESLMNRDQVHDTFGQCGLEKMELDLLDGRNISVYAVPRTGPDKPLQIFDIPTTLLTSDTVIKRIDNFWGGGDRRFRESLERREIASFERSVQERITENRLSDKVKTIRIADLSQAVAAAKA
jgi:hypothetical protein